jgi:hypothetical protein
LESQKRRTGRGEGEKTEKRGEESEERREKGEERVVDRVVSVRA